MGCSTSSDAGNAIVPASPRADSKEAVDPEGKANLLSPTSDLTHYNSLMQELDLADKHEEERAEMARSQDAQRIAECPSLTASGIARRSAWTDDAALNDTTSSYPIEEIEGEESDDAGVPTPVSIMKSSSGSIGSPARVSGMRGPLATFKPSGYHYPQQSAAATAKGSTMNGSTGNKPVSLGEVRSPSIGSWSFSATPEGSCRRSSSMLGGSVVSFSADIPVKETPYRVAQRRSNDAADRYRRPRRRPIPLTPKTVFCCSID